MGKFLAFWKNWDDNQKRTATRIAGLCFGALALLTLISTVSYLFTWKADQSLFSNPEMMSLEVEVSNAAGKLGFDLGHFLVCKCFGLASFALLIIFVAISIRLLAQKWQTSLLKTILVALTGAFSASVLLAYIGRLAGIPAVFGSGLGGQCGAFLVNWSCNLFGAFLTGMLTLLLVICWLFCVSKKFSDKVGSLVERSEAEDLTVVEEETVDLTDIPESILEPEPVIVAPVAEKIVAPAPSKEDS